MDRLLQQFEHQVADAAGTVFNIYLYGRSRPHDTWQGWLVFERIPDGQRFSTDVETTQSNAEGILYWATGLTDAYFEGALQRALRPALSETAPYRIPEPIVGGPGDSASRRRRLAELERTVLDCFTRLQSTRLLTQRVFDEIPHAHADVVRALEDLEKQGGLLVRRTEAGNDWLMLTAEGARATGLSELVRGTTVVEREPPRTP